ncbi:protein PNS1 isoform X1 [Primulina tabacum]|uniref:protein PNS1 isoform X1 n=1 Tax=Primulina tabacum TaxID=48773 RepID=UPI003F5A54B6
MGATEPVVVHREEEESMAESEENKDKREEVKDLEKGEMNIHSRQESTVETHPPSGFHMSRMQRLSNTNPLRLVIDNATRVAASSPYQQQPRPSPSPLQQPRTSSSPLQQPRPSPSPLQQPRSTPTPQQQSVASLNPRSYTNKFSLVLFLLHIVLAIGLMGFLIFKGVQGLLREGRTKREEKRVVMHFLPQVEAASFLSITLAFIWQKAVRLWPRFMVRFIIWSSFALSLSAGILLICFQMPATDGVGVLFIAFAIGNGLYACWVTQRTSFCSRLFIKALEPAAKFHDINHPIYWMLGAGFLWMSVWIFAVIGAFNFYVPPALVIIVLVLSLAWVAEVMRNVANMTVSRVISLYYLRGMQSSTQFCFQRALSKNLGSASLGSLFVPAIEALRIVARGLNLIEGEDEFMFSCAHCCLRVMESIFSRGNGWAYVQIAAYGKGFVQASQDTWELFKKREMEVVVDSDITSAICFLTGICSGSICTIVVVAWTSATYRGYMASLAVLSAFIGYLMTRIAMALPHACVSCYYVCYAENPDNRLFDKTIQDRIDLIKSGRDVAVPTPRVPRRFMR